MSQTKNFFCTHQDYWFLQNPVECWESQGVHFRKNSADWTLISQPEILSPLVKENLHDGPHSHCYPQIQHNNCVGSPYFFPGVHFSFE